MRVDLRKAEAEDGLMARLLARKTFEPRQSPAQIFDDIRTAAVGLWVIGLATFSFGLFSLAILDGKWVHHATSPFASL